MGPYVYTGSAIQALNMLFLFDRVCEAFDTSDSPKDRHVITAAYMSNHHTV